MSIYINEVHPNPESGSEWVELITTEALEDNFSLDAYTIFDSSRQIYQFSDEQFIDQLLVVELSGLNNDTDSVILKDAQGNILDAFTYEKSEKGSSWSREIDSADFVLTTPSRNLDNPTTEIASPEPTITITPTSITPTPTEITPTISLTANPTQTTEKTQADKKILQNYNLKDINLNIQTQDNSPRQSRLVILGKNPEQAIYINAIIGSFLVIASAVWLIYVRLKKKHH